jgi:hypothetical protein
LSLSRASRDTECGFWVNDPEVSPNEVSDDIDVNGTRIRVQYLVSAWNGLPMEIGRSEIDEDGRIH